MVNDNEVLKRDNGELQHLLTEAREEIHRLHEEFEEQQANPSTPSRTSRSGGATICRIGVVIVNINISSQHIHNEAPILKQHSDNKCQRLYSNIAITSFSNER